MGRWDISDDARSLEQSSDRTPERTDTTPHDHDLRITPLPERVSPRSRPDLGEGREHSLTLPQGREREAVRDNGRVHHLRSSEVDLLERAGQYRVTFTDDLKQDSGDARFGEDLRSLKEQGLIDERTVTHLREGTVADVVSVTPAGRELLDHHRHPEHDQEQAYYGGWVKPGEVWHDASVFRMVREVESELAREGASVQRVVLDDELKANAFRALHEARSHGETNHNAHRTVAEAQGLHIEDDRFVFPDVRLEVLDRDGTERTVDLELVTKEYHRGHLSGKAAAGFRMFAGGSGSTRGGTPTDPDRIGKLLR
jgi:DNA-binding PadR family transcriptional regulator